MLPNIEIPVIETYTELAAVATAVAAAILVLVLTWRRLRTTRRARKSASLSNHPFIAPRAHALRGLKRRRHATQHIDFDKLASMISSATDRAEHLSQTQSAAALKLDTAEVAVNRLLADIDGIMTVTRPPVAPVADAPLPVVPAAHAEQPQRPSIAA